MKKYILLSFMLGAATGASLCMLVLEKKHREDVDNIYDQELSKEREELRELITSRKEEKQQKEADVISEVNRETEERLRPDVPLAPPVSYTEVSKPYKPDLKELTRRDRTEEVLMNKPYVIDIQEFAEGRPEFDKLSIYYYADDGVLVDENEEMIEDIEALIGDEALLCFDDPERYEPDVVYVRNERISIDYEVVREEGRFGEVVGGDEGDE